MKKISYILLILLLLCGCGKKEDNNKIPKKEKTEVGTMLTCEENNITYTFYYNNNQEYYYKATYLVKYKYNNNIDAEAKEQELKDMWYDKYGDSLMEVDFKVNDNTAFMTLSAYHDTDEDMYINFFGDRYNLNIDDMNTTFNNECLIKSIKK